MKLTSNSQTPPLKTIGIYFPYFMGGGAEAVGLWILEALKDKYDLTLFTFANVNWEQLNAMYGTSLSSQQIRVKSILPAFSQPLASFLIANNPHIRQFSIHSTLGFLKKNSHHYDLMISGFNAADLGVPGIQYVHWINVLEGGRLAPIYSNISQFSRENLRKNISVANSSEVAESVRKNYNIDAEVIYPPVVIAPQSKDITVKENAFVCSGRLVESKQPHKAIKILQKVREKGHDIKLYITGGGGGSAESSYENLVKKMVKENADWVTLYENLSYSDYAKILYKCKYGIHLKQEPFGISVAEMVRAGAIPFVKSQGGQTEIVGRQNTELFFANEEQAPETIVAVLESSELQQKLVSSLQDQQNLFSTGHFRQEIVDLVAQYFAK